MTSMHYYSPINTHTCYFRSTNTSWRNRAAQSKYHHHTCPVALSCHPLEPQLAPWIGKTKSSSPTQSSRAAAASLLSPSRRRKARSQSTRPLVLHLAPWAPPGSGSGSRRLSAGHHPKSSLPHTLWEDQRAARAATSATLKKRTRTMSPPSTRRLLLSQCQHKLLITFRAKIRERRRARGSASYYWTRACSRSVVVFVFV